MIYMYISFVSEEFGGSKGEFRDRLFRVWFQADEAVNTECLTMPGSLAGGLLRGDKRMRKRKKHTGLPNGAGCVYR